MIKQNLYYQNATFYKLQNAFNNSNALTFRWICILAGLLDTVKDSIFRVIIENKFN